MKKTGILIIIIFLILNISCSKKKVAKESFSFVFMTDIHIQPERDAIQGFLQAIDTVNMLNPDFVLTGGDLIMDALGQSYERSDSLYNIYEETISNLKMPVYNTMGNHEVFGLYKSSGIDPDHELYGKKMFENRINNPYHSFDYKNWHFIVLDGIGFTKERRYYGHIDSLQLEWLKEDLLKTGTEKPVAICTHIPLLSVGSQIMTSPTEGFGENLIITNAHDVFKIIEDYNIKFVLQGHLHFLEDINYNGVHYITGGAVSSDWWRGTRYGLEEGFLKIDISDDQFKWDYIDFGWVAEENQ